MLAENFPVHSTALIGCLSSQTGCYVNLASNMTSPLHTDGLFSVCEIVFAEIIDHRSRVKMIHHKPTMYTCRPVMLSSSKTLEITKDRRATRLDSLPSPTQFLPRSSPRSMGKVAHCILCHQWPVRIVHKYQFKVALITMIFRTSLHHCPCYHHYTQINIARDRFRIIGIQCVFFTFMSMDILMILIQLKLNILLEFLRWYFFALLKYLWKAFGACWQCTFCQDGCLWFPKVCKSIEKIYSCIIHINYIISHWFIHLYC